jgi:glycosyltransferase involved in cell wall biosynthesis
MTRRILFIVPYVPNPVRVRPYNLIRALAGRGNQITLATLWSSEDECLDLEALNPYVTQTLAFPLPKIRSAFNCALAVPSGAPLQSVYCWQPALARAMRDILRRQSFDVVHVEHLRGAKYGVDLMKRLGQAAPPIVWDSVDSISLLFRQAMQKSRTGFSRFITRFEVGRTERMEADLIRRFARVIVTSPADRQALFRLLPDGAPLPSVDVIPNGVDLRAFKMDASDTRRGDTLVVSGKMSYHANVAMVLKLAAEVMPQVWAFKPEVRLVVAGKDPGPELMALARDPRIIITGTVPNLAPYLRSATVAVAPVVYGVGIQNKVLEAMACGTPVVAAPQAVSALEAVAGRDMLTAETADGIAAAVVSLLQDPFKRDEIGRNGRAYVETHHDWDRIAERLEEVYQSAGR